MITAVIVVAVLAYLAFHLGAGHTHHRYRIARGLRPNFYWSSVRGPYASIRLPGGFRVGHRLHGVPAESIAAIPVQQNQRPPDVNPRRPRVVEGFASDHALVANSGH